MRRGPWPLEIIGYLTLSTTGLIAFDEGVTDRLATLLVGGAVCITPGLITLVYAIRNILWNRDMLRRSSTVEKSDLEL